MRHLALTGLFWLLGAYVAAAQTHAHEQFVRSNILAVFYHELGHAVIDIEDLPIFGQEEDAADVFSVFMIHSLFEEEAAQGLAFDAAYGFRAEAEFAEHTGQDEIWWGTHGANAQRFYNSVCIFYGANPRARGAFAEDMGLPEERADYCHEEFDQADHSWGSVLDELIERGAGQSLQFEGLGTGSLAAELLAYEAEFLNGELQLASPLRIVVEECGVANAFYDPSERLIIFCTEFEDYFKDMARWLL
jgi:hypothetical protein